MFATKKWLQNTQSCRRRFSVKVSTKTQSNLCLKPFPCEEYCAMTYIISAYLSPSFVGSMLALFCKVIAAEFADIINKKLKPPTITCWFYVALVHNAHMNTMF